MLNPDERAALARGIVTVLAGAVVWYAIWRLLGWQVTVAIVVYGLVVAAVDALRCPWWRLW